MKTYKSTALLDSLKADTRQIILTVKQLLQEDPGILVAQPASGKWSVAQVIEHLNTYGRYYLPAIETAISKSHYRASIDFKPGWFGNYFTNSMKPTPEREIKNKMKAMKGYRPPADLDSKTVLEECLQQQVKLLELLDRANNYDISRIRIPVSIAQFIKLKLGDTFRFLIAHQQRHMIQCENALAVLRTVEGKAIRIQSSLVSSR
jgi:hypothetical protein